MGPITKHLAMSSLQMSNVRRLKNPNVKCQASRKGKCQMSAASARVGSVVTLQQSYFLIKIFLATSGKILMLNLELFASYFLSRTRRGVADEKYGLWQPRSDELGPLRSDFRCFFSRASSTDRIFIPPVMEQSVVWGAPER